MKNWKGYIKKLGMLNSTSCPNIHKREFWKEFMMPNALNISIYITARKDSINNPTI
jgi:hypothetical protein